MEFLVKCVLLAICAVSIVSSHFVTVPVGFFGDTKNEDLKQEIIGNCTRACGIQRNLAGTYSCSYAHPTACNLYIQCVRFGSTFVIHGVKANDGMVYDQYLQQPVNAFIPPNIPDYRRCIGIGHPCQTKRPVPVDGSLCGGYLLCENNMMVNYNCPNGTGFSAQSGRCDLPCDQALRRILKTECGPSTKGKTFFEVKETVVYGNSQVPVVEGYNGTCPAFTSYQDTTKCGCDRIVNITIKACETITLLHFSSSDNSWQLARNNTPLNNGGSLEGDARVVEPSNRSFRRSAFFNGRGSHFISSKFTQNDLGLYSALSFTVQAVRDDGTRGVTLRDNERFPVFIALADNSAGENEASYGCMLRVESQTTCKIECYVKPSKTNSGQESDDVTVVSPELDVRKKISVNFAKDDTRGKLTVAVEGEPEQSKEFRFPPGVRAVGNRSPFIIGAGFAKRPFAGYIDDMDLRRYCKSFM